MASFPLNDATGNSLWIPFLFHIPDSKVHVADMGPTWVLLSPGGPHVGPMNLPIWDVIYNAMSFILMT